MRILLESSQNSVLQYFSYNTCFFFFSFSFFFPLFPFFQNVPHEFCYVAVDESILPTSIMTFLAYGKLVARNWIQKLQLLYCIEYVASTKQFLRFVRKWTSEAQREVFDDTFKIEQRFGVRKRQSYPGRSKRLFESIIILPIRYHRTNFQIVSRLFNNALIN